MSKYWREEGEFQAEFTKMTEELMPAMGAADTFAGEVIRAVNRLYYEAFNNGWGNNVSGAWHYLKQVLRPEAGEFGVDLDKALAAIKPYVNMNRGGVDTPDRVNDALDALCTIAVKWAQANPERAAEDNEVDMLDLSDKDNYGRYDDEDDEDDWY